MKIQLTPDLLRFLTGHGFTYCLSRTELLEDGNIHIVLTPVAFKPHVRHLKDRYDTYFALRREPVQMARGIDDETLVFVDLSRAEAASYLKDTLSAAIGQKLIFRLSAGHRLNA